MRPSVIVSTYNQPRWLEKVLWGYASQTHRDFELVLADDGSGPETREVVERVSAAARLPILHVWHEDRGFRKTEILNRAIVAAGSEYLIFTDGDCVPRHDFVATHARLAEPGRFLSGTTIRLPLDVSEAMTIDDVRAGHHTDLAWLESHGFRVRSWRRRLRYRCAPRINGFMDSFSTTGALFDGNNASTWRTALEAVNGFDVDMGYGFEDRVVGARLANLGVRRKRIRYRAITVHLEHSRPYIDQEVFRRNERTLREIRRRGETRAVHGLAETRAQLVAEARGGDPRAAAVAAHVEARRTG